MKRYLLFLISFFLLITSLRAQKVFSCKQDLFPFRHPEKKMYGYVDIMGREVVRPFFDYAHSFNEGLAVVQKKSKYGVINCDGKIVVRVEYDEITTFLNGYAWVKKSNLWGLVDFNGKTILECQYDEVQDISKFSDYAWLKTGNKWGVFDKEKVKFVHKPQFDEFQQINAKTSLISINQKKGMIKHADSIPVLLPDYDAITKFAPYLLKISKDGKHGVVSDYGKKMLKANYDAIYNLTSGRFSVIKEGKQALYTSRGKRLVPFVLDSLSPFNEAVSVVKRGSEYAFLSLKGKRLFDTTFTYATPFYEGRSIAKHIDKQVFLLNKKGQMTSKFYDTIVKHDEGYYSALSNEKYDLFFNENQLIATNKETITMVYGGQPNAVRVETQEGVRLYNVFMQQFRSGLIFDEISDWNEWGYAKVVQDGKYGFLDSTFKVVIKPEYKSLTLLEFDGKVFFKAQEEGSSTFWFLNDAGIKMFEETYLDIQYAGKNKFIVTKETTNETALLNSKGQKLIDFKYFAMQYNHESTSYLGLNSKGKYCLIDEKGENRLKKKYEGLTYLGFDHFSAHKKGKETILNGKGEVVIEAKYMDYVSFHRNNVYIVEYEGLYALCNKLGELLTKYDYNEIFNFTGNYAICKKGVKYGILNKSGKKAYKAKFSKLETKEDGYILSNDEEQIHLTFSGKIIK